ncbi:putative MFS family arabinose efflux permease [Micromonospora sp. Llam0]|uniref:MFS transporter n=1 Tax=Micromonospora sp. Llam0 TaxID=2485143 RepID=UPI000F480B38|nr:MFS transporter [Micromonospora sp. Llam0]ROO62743.1 putative MFS family arabinose efflux permease [Micromonospora sp. Llam0]
MTTPTTGSSASPADRATFRDLFAVGEFRALFASYGIFMIGETVKMLALSVLVYQRTNSPLLAALAYVAGFLPSVVGGMFLLAYADRWRPRTVMVGYDLIRVVTVVVLAIGVLPPVGALALVFTVGLVSPVASAARTALLPDLLAGDRYVLGRALFTITAGATQVLGFAVGGALIGLFGPYGALWITAVTCLTSTALIRFGLSDRAARVVGAAATGGAVRETWRVNRQLLADPPVRGLLLATWLPGALLVGAEGVVVPYAGGEGAAGVLFMAGAGGMLLGDLVVGRWVAPARREALTPWLALLLGVPMLAFVADLGLLVAAVLFGAATFGFSYHLGLARRFLDAVPPDRRGQAFGLSHMGMMTGQGLAAGAAGLVAEWVAPGLVMAGFGALSLVATLLLWRQLRVPRMNVPRHA